MQGIREPRTPPTRWATALSFAQELKRIDKQELKVSDGDKGHDPQQLGASRRCASACHTLCSQRSAAQRGVTEGNDDKLNGNCCYDIKM